MARLLVIADEVEINLGPLEALAPEWSVEVEAVVIDASVAGADAVIVDAATHERATALYHRVRRLVLHTTPVVIVTEEIVNALFDFLFSAHDAYVGFLVRGYGSQEVQHTLGILCHGNDSVRVGRFTARVGRDEGERALHHLREAVEGFSAMTERVGDLAIARVLIEFGGVELRAELQLDLVHGRLHFDGVLPAGRPIADFVPARGLRKFTKIFRADQEVGDRVLDEAFLIRAEPNQAEAIKALRQQLVVVVGSELRIHNDGLVADGFLDHVRPFLELWRVIARRRLGV